MIKVTDKMVYIFCDYLPLSQRPKQSIVKKAYQVAMQTALDNK